MKLHISTAAAMVVHVIAVLAAVVPVLDSPLTAGESGNPEGLSFRYEQPADGAKVTQLYQGSVKSVGDVVYVYATVQMGPANPIPFAGGLPQWRPQGAPAAPVTKKLDQDQAAALGGFVVQKRKPIPKDRPQFLEVIALGQQVGGQFVPVVRFGLADDRRAMDNAHVTAWVSDGRIDYFGLHARPNTPYDFRIRLDLKRKRMTAWISGRGDDDWFLMAEDVPLAKATPAIDRLQVEISPNGPPISGLMVRAAPWGPGEQVRPHPLAKHNRAVGPDRGFRFQSQRSTWRKPGTQVTIFRKQGVHAAFPDVAQAGPDHLVCVWRNGGHTGGDPGLSVAHSYDLGKTWGDPVAVFNRGNCPRLQRLKDGTLLLIVDEGEGDETNGTWNAVLWDSTDGGKTWTNERRLKPRELNGPPCIVPSHVCEMADGSWLLAAGYWRKLPEDASKHLINLVYYRSADRGRTWQLVPQPFYSSSIAEPSPIQLPDGRLVVYARGNRTDGMPGGKGYSTDGGKTWQYQELSHPMTGRTCANLFQDGRMMLTFRSGVGRASLWAWIGSPDDSTQPRPVGGHYNDRHTAGLKDGALHIDNDGACGQFTRYNLRPTDSDQSTVELTFEVQVLANAGRAASVTVPFAGVLRLFPDHVVMAHDPSLRAAVKPGEFHTYRVVSRFGRMELYIDGQPAWATDKGDGRLIDMGWLKTSGYALAFGNEPRSMKETTGCDYPHWWVGMPDVYPVSIPAEVTGYSIWRRFEVKQDDPKAGKRALAWNAEKDGFPDQYQLDHIIQVDASANGHDQGYSGWTQLDDGRVFLVNYTDDTSAASSSTPHMFGVPWIRGTFLQPDDVTSKP